MPRPYSEKFLLELHRSSDPNRAGVRLAKACVDANLPAKYVADVLGVTRMTVYSWFRGKPLRDKNQRLVETFTELVERDLQGNVLPVMTIAAAKVYLEDMVGRPLKD
jgi:hypothetical protein